MREVYKEVFNRVALRPSHNVCMTLINKLSSTTPSMRDEP